MKRKRKSASVTSYLSTDQKRELNRLRITSRTTYADLVRGALYEKYPQLRQ